MTDWWKNPILQGPENDYGEYDYMVSYDYLNMPEDYQKWVWSWEKHKCSDDGRYAHLYRVWESFFQTCDGYDSVWGSESAYSIIVIGTKNKIKRNIRKTINNINHINLAIESINKYGKDLTYKQKITAYKNIMKYVIEK